MALNQNHVVQSAKTDYYYDHYDCSYTIQSRIKLSDCVLQDMSLSQQAALKEFAQQKLNKAVQEINDVAQKLIHHNY
jgi:hypothetical protein